MSVKIEKQDKNQKPTKMVQKTKRRTSMLLAILLGLATVVGGLAAIATFLPRVSVVASDPVDTSHPVSASFTIINTNFITLNDVNALLGIGQIAIGPVQLDNKFLPSFESRLVRPEWQNHTLKMDEKFTMTIADVFKFAPTQFNGADIAIIISYKPWILPIRREKVFRFVTRKQTNGLFYWYSLPLNATNYILESK